MSTLPGIIQAATQHWEVSLDITEAEGIAHEIECRGSFTPATAEGTYPQYPSDKVRDMVEARDSGRIPT